MFYQTLSLPKRKSPPTLALLCIVVFAGCGTAPLFVHKDGVETSTYNWVSQLYQKHQLAGQVWDSRQGRFVPVRTLVSRLKDAPIVLVGERHDQPDHHRIQG